LYSSCEPPCDHFFIGVWVNSAYTTDRPLSYFLAQWAYHWRHTRLSAASEQTFNLMLYGVRVALSLNHASYPKVDDIKSSFFNVSTVAQPRGVFKFLLMVGWNRPDPVLWTTCVVLLVERTNV
jgi:hypothetical protein